MAQGLYALGFVGCTGLGAWLRALIRVGGLHGVGTGFSIWGTGFQFMVYGVDSIKIMCCGCICAML